MGTRNGKVSLSDEYKVKGARGLNNETQTPWDPPLEAKARLGGGWAQGPPGLCRSWALFFTKQADRSTTTTRQCLPCLKPPAFPVLYWLTLRFQDANSKCVSNQLVEIYPKLRAQNDLCDLMGKKMMEQSEPLSPIRRRGPGPVTL